MRAKVLILGAGGLLGAMVWRVLQDYSGIAPTATTRNGADGTQRFEVESGAEGIRGLFDTAPDCDLVVNTIGILSHRIDPGDRASIAHADRVNGRFPHDLAAAAKTAGVRVLHISTDGVFAPGSGDVDEHALADANDPYGRSKRDGECNAAHVLNLRCSIIGPDPLNGRGLWEWLAGQPDGTAVSGFTNQKWCGVTSCQVAELVVALADPVIFEAARDEGPTHHFCPNPPLTKCELLCLLRDVLRPDLKIEPATSSQPVSRTLTTCYRVLAALPPRSREWCDLIDACRCVALSPS